MLANGVDLSLVRFQSSPPTNPNQPPRQSAPQLASILASSLFVQPSRLGWPRYRLRLTGVCTCPTSHQLGFMDIQELLEVGCQIMYDLPCSLLVCAINKLCKGLCLTFLILIDVFPCHNNVYIVLMTFKPISPSNYLSTHCPPQYSSFITTSHWRQSALYTAQQRTSSPAHSVLTLCTTNSSWHNIRLCTALLPSRRHLWTLD